METKQLPIHTIEINDLLAREQDRAPLTRPHEQYQSRIFSTGLALNPLVAASSALLILANHLRSLTIAPNLDHLQQALCHEVKAFENKAQLLGYRAQVILAARYLLCAFIDEIIYQSIWYQQDKHIYKGLLHTFQHEHWANNRFFVILERSAEDPMLYIDLLELGYLCLSLGYQGKYQGQNNYQALANEIDHLYQLIRHQRGDAHKHCLQTLKKKPKKIKQTSLPSLKVGITAALVILFAVFFPYYQHLKNNATSVKQTLTQIVNQYGTK